MAKKKSSGLIDFDLDIDTSLDALDLDIKDFDIDINLDSLDFDLSDFDLDIDI